ncbi:MAG: DUF4198 domain-containing protein [Sphingomonas sp.]
MRLFRTPFAAAVALVAIATPQIAAAAPRPWLLPSETMFAGSGDEWLTVDAAISTDLYYFDHPAQAWQPVVFAPDGTQGGVENLAKARQRLTFDVHITQRGTYRLSVFTESVMGSYMLDGERKMLPRGTTPATLAEAIPAGATEVWSAVNSSRIETFATAGEPTTTVFKPVGKGIEIVPVTHPTDLSTGEAAVFQFLLDGRPAAGLTVSAVNGGVRYRDGLTQLSLTTDADGKVTIKWPEAGMWWVSATNAQPRGEGGPGAGGPGAAPGGPGEGGPRPPMGPPQSRATYAMTVEVLPS